MRAVLATVAALGLAASVQGAVVHQETFGTTPESIESYSYGGGPNINWGSMNYPMPAPVVTNVGGVVSVAFDWRVPTPDPSGGNYNQMWWCGGGSGIWAALSATPATSDLSQWAFSFDGKAAGLTGASTNISMEYQIQRTDAAGGGNILVLQHPFTLTNTMQTFPTSFDTWTVTGGSIAALQTALGNGSINGVWIQWSSNGNGFGYDNNNVVSVDNYITTAPVPEPTVIAGLAAASLGLMIRKRQK